MSRLPNFNRAGQGLTVDNDDQKKFKRYNSFQSIINANDIEALEHYLTEYKEQKKLDDLLTPKAGKQLSDFNLLLYEVTKYEEYDDAKKTGLHIDKIVELLTKFGANLDCSPSNGITPYMQAMVDNNVPAAKAFVKYGAKTDLMDGGMQHAGYHAIMHNSYEALEYHLSINPAQVDAVDFDGLSLLHWAAREGDAKAVDILIKYHANPTLQTRDDDDPYVAHQAVPEGAEFEALYEKMRKYYQDYSSGNIPSAKSSTTSPRP